MDKVNKGPLTLNCTCGPTPLSQPCDTCKDEVAKYFNLPFTASGTITPRHGYTVPHFGKYAVSDPFGTQTIELPPGYLIDPEFPQRIYATFINAEPKCECGSDSVGSPHHSNWCNKYGKV